MGRAQLADRSFGEFRKDNTIDPSLCKKITPLDDSQTLQHQPAKAVRLFTELHVHGIVTVVAWQSGHDIRPQMDTITWTSSSAVS